MWCFFDESYPEKTEVTAIVGCLMQSRALRHLEGVMYQARKRHFGDANAKDGTAELKGTSLLSSASFRFAAKYGTSKNHELVTDVLNDCIRTRNKFPIKIFASVVYGTKDVLTKATEERLVLPLKHILNVRHTAKRKM